MRRTLAAACLAALTVFGAAAPWFGLAPRAAAASCSNWTSEQLPPPTIRVFRHVTGAVETVDFRAYTKNVLSREWIGSWTTESLRSGALAVKHYAWYQVLHWRGGVNGSGECFDLRDDTSDQVYNPSQPTWSTAAAAVDATWATRVLKNGAIFPTYYNAGAANEACGSNANGWKMFQWGTQGCGLASRTAAEIVLVYYYPGVSVTDAPAPTDTPVPTPTATPLATPSPTPVPTPTPDGSPGPSPTTAPTPAPTPLPPPPPIQEQPGGGQTTIVNAVAPPSPPPADPKPVVAAPEASRPAPVIRQRTPHLTRGLLESIDLYTPTGPIVSRWLGGELRPASAQVLGDPLALLGALWRMALREIVAVLALDLAADRPPLAGLGLD